MAELPTYIDQLLKYHLSNNNIIKLNYIELMNEYEWMDALFIKFMNNKELLNISNLCNIFCNCDEIEFTMPSEYILSYDECISLIQHELPLISAMDIRISITFLWPLEIPITNKSRINEYQQQL